jgi:hypothetical protein
VVIALATEPKVHGFKPGQGRLIFNGVKNPYHDFLRKETKPSVPCREILRHVRVPYGVCKRYFVGKIHGHFSPSFSFIAIRQSNVKARELWWMNQESLQLRRGETVNQKTDAVLGSRFQTRPRPGLKQRTLGPMAGKITTRPPITTNSRRNCYYHLNSNILNFILEKCSFSSKIK